MVLNKGHEEGQHLDVGAFVVIRRHVVAWLKRRVEHSRMTMGEGQCQWYGRVQLQLPGLVVAVLPIVSLDSSSDRSAWPSPTTPSDPYQCRPLILKFNQRIPCGLIPTAYR